MSINQFLPLLFSLKKIKHNSDNKKQQQSTTTKSNSSSKNNSYNQNPFQKMFSSFSLTLFALNASLVGGIQLRGTFDSRNLEVEDTSTCIPVGDAPFNKVAYVAVDLSGTDALNATTFDLFNLATAFELAYENQVDCSAVPGSRREVGRTNTLIEAVGPDGASTQLLRVELFCNACGDDDEIELFRDSSSRRKADDEDTSVVQCACDGPFIPTFLGLYNEIFAATTFASISIIDVDQLPVLDCGEQNFTTYNASGVCLGLDALAFQDDQVDFPSSAPSVYPSEYPSEYPSQFPSEFPTEYPSETPTDKPSKSPSRPPTERPTSKSPTSSPTIVVPTADSVVATPSPTVSRATPSPTAASAVATPSPTVSRATPSPTAASAVATPSPTVLSPSMGVQTEEEILPEKGQVGQEEGTDEDELDEEEKDNDDLDEEEKDQVEKDEDELDEEKKDEEETDEDGLDEEENDEDRLGDDEADDNDEEKEEEPEESDEPKDEEEDPMFDVETVDEP
ncbi:hypothetical protein IV203_003909 [Nitzschia inconspicua]|uniref:Uncharacterized protein n=1 Tax=Nitzschia inconspicua TaxID=303405 RepID=A0A9K3PPC5_9STRA|nr:hypothetical protein IV203_003909 [Nitzschia inconspicua]